MVILPPGTTKNKIDFLLIPAILIKRRLEIEKSAFRIPVC